MTEQQPPADSSDAQPSSPPAEVSPPAAVLPPSAPEPPQPPAAVLPPSAPGPPPPGYAPPPTWPPQGATPPPAAYPPPPGGTPPAGYPPPAYAYGYAPSPPTSTNAIVGLVLAIISWILCPVIPAIIALVLASKSQQEIRASQGAVGGEGLNLATRIIAWINIGVWGLLIVGFGLVFLLVLLGIVGSTSPV